MGRHKGLPAPRSRRKGHDRGGSATSNLPYALGDDHRGESTPCFHLQTSGSLLDRAFLAENDDKLHSFGFVITRELETS